MMIVQNRASLQQKMNEQRALRDICGQAISQQIERGQAQATHRRNRKRHLAKQVLKKIPSTSKRSSKQLLHAATMVLAMWGFTGLSAPTTAAAAPLFKHLTLEGFAMANNTAPSFADIDGDGDLDAFVGETSGIVKFYRNTKVDTDPVAQGRGFVADAAGNPLVGFDVGYFAAPTFADIDGDGDLDAFVGEIRGTVKFYRNDDLSGNGTAPAFVADALGNPLAAVAIAGRRPSTTPTFADIDNDGDLDAFVGGEDGTVKFYQNDGTAAAPVFVATGGATLGGLVVNPLAGVAVGGRAAPAFADIDGDGDLDAFVGETSGTMKFYRNDDLSGNGTAPAFVADALGNPLVDAAGVPFDAGLYASPTFADIDGDGDLDVFVGEFYYNVKYFRNTQIDAVAPGTGFVASTASNPLVAFDVGGFVTPTFTDIDGDGDLDTFMGELLGTVKFYRNDDLSGNGTAPAFVADAAGNPLVDAAGAAFDVGYYAAPAFADIDGDGDLDAFVGESLGRVKFYRNTQIDAVAPGTGFVADTAGNPLAGVVVAASAKPTFIDIDGDGDLDAFVGEQFGTVKFYRNTEVDADPVAQGTGFVADAVGNPLVGFDVGFIAAPTFVDIDGDGDLDAFVGESSGTVKFYRNNGSNLTPVFAADAGGNPLAGFSMRSLAAPTFADIDGDGDFDAFVGEKYGKVKFYENFDPSPITTDDALAASTDVAATTVDVTLNDTFKAEGPAANFTIIADATSVNGGTVANNGDNTFTFTSAAGFAGTDSFTYTLDDGIGNTAVGTVTVTIPDTTAPVITAPAAITVAATSASGIAITDVAVAAFIGGATATDNVGITSVTHDAPAILPVGVTTVVTFTAFDAAGNSTTGSGTVTVTAFVPGTAPVAGGGCVIQLAAKFDPTFPAVLVLLAGLGLTRRRQK